MDANEELETLTKHWSRPMSKIRGKSWSEFRDIMTAGVAEDNYGGVEAALHDFETIGIDLVVDELKSLGIEFGDLKPDNLLMRGNDLVVIDLGVSKSPGAEPSTLESFKHVTNDKNMVESIMGIPHIHDLSEDKFWEFVKLIIFQELIFHEA